MDDFRLKVFVTAAKSLSFTRCAEQLFISQPAVSRHIGELESLYKIQLFVRQGNHLTLTAAGRVMLPYAENILEKYRLMRYEMGLRSNNIRGELHIGASSTIAQYVLPPVLARFSARFPDIKMSLMSGNSEQVETALMHNDIELGLVENASHRQGLRYMKFIPDELVIVASSTGAHSSRDEITLEELKHIPLVLRESGSGTLEVVSRYLAGHGIKLSMLDIVMQMGSTESIKSFVRNSSSMAIVSVQSVLEELKSDKLKVIDIAEGTIERDFSFVMPDGRSDALAERFMEFARNTV